jgi:hypothetical protein
MPGDAVVASESLAAVPALQDAERLAGPYEVSLGDQLTLFKSGRFVERFQDYPADTWSGRWQVEATDVFLTYGAQAAESGNTPLQRRLPVKVTPFGDIRLVDAAK